VDLRAATPVYRQIVDGLRAMLVGGAFQPGDKLPTVRQMAVDLGVHHNTVAEAYRLLEEEGWLDLRRRHGATVILRPPQSASPRHQDDYTRALREATARALADGLDLELVAGILNQLAESIKQQKKGTCS
jgi:GntR family transcriptional regulator